MLRVLQVFSKLGRGGAETMIMNYYRNIDRSQIQFDFLVQYPDKETYEDEIESLGGKIYRIDPIRKVGPYKYKKELYNFFQKHPYQIIHSHRDEMSGLVLKEAYRANIPIRIAHSHTSVAQYNFLESQLKNIYKKMIHKYATHRLACSTTAGEWMYLGDKYKILKNAIQTEIFKFSPLKRKKMRKEFNILDNHFIIGHVGNFTYPKNHEFLVDIFYEIQKTENNTILFLVGDGPLRGKIENKVKKLGMSNKVIFAGERSDVSDLMQLMDVFVFPSRFEGLGIVLIEAQAAGLPCLASEKVIPNEVKVTELLKFVDLKDPPDIWAKEILEHGKLCRQKNSAKEVQNAQYDIKENSIELIRFYKSLI